MKLFSSKQKKDLKAGQGVDPFLGITFTKNKQDKNKHMNLINMENEISKLLKVKKGHDELKKNTVSKKYAAAVVEERFNRGKTFAKDKNKPDKDILEIPEDSDKNNQYSSRSVS